MEAAVEGFRALDEPGFVAATQAELACAHLALNDLAAARSLAEQAAIAIHAGQHGVDQPQAILFTLYRVLQALGDHRGAQEALASAHSEIEEQTSRLQDPELRASFLQTIHINREIAAALQSPPVS